MTNRIFIFDLPHIQDTVAQYLTRKDLSNCALTNKTWHQVFTPLLWQSLHLNASQIKVLLACKDGQHALFHHHSQHIRHLSTPQPHIFPFLPRTCLKSLTLTMPVKRWYVSTVPDSDPFDYDDSPGNKEQGYKEFFEFLDQNPRLEKFSMDGFPLQSESTALGIVSRLIKSRTGEKEAEGVQRGLQCMQEISLGGYDKHPPILHELVLIQVVDLIADAFPKLERLRLDFAHFYSLKVPVEEDRTARTARLWEETFPEALRMWSIKCLTFDSPDAGDEPPPNLLNMLLKRCPNLQTLDMKCLGNYAAERLRYHLRGERPVPVSQSSTNGTRLSTPVPMPRLTALQGLRIHSRSGALSQTQLADLLDAFPVGQLRQLQLYLPQYALQVFASLERHASKLEDVSLHLPWLNSGGTMAVQHLLSHGVNLKRIRAFVGVENEVMKLSVAEILLGDPWVCDQLEEWVIGIKDVPRCPQQYGRKLAEKQMDEVYTVESGCEVEFVEDEKMSKDQENAHGHGSSMHTADMDVCLQEHDDDSSLGDEDDKDFEDDNDSEDGEYQGGQSTDGSIEDDEYDDSEGMDEEYLGIHTHFYDDAHETLVQQMERLDRLYEYHLEPTFDSLAHAASARVITVNEDGAPAEVDPSTAMMTPKRIKSLALQRQILARFSKMACLRVLSLSPDYSNQEDSLEFSIESGLDLLDSCRHLEQLSIRGYDTWIGRAEVKWMKAHWPHLKVLEGLMKHDVKARKESGMNGFTKSVLPHVQLKI